MDEWMDDGYRGVDMHNEGKMGLKCIEPKARLRKLS